VKWIPLFLGVVAVCSGQQYSAADLARGKKLFEAQCSLCHGQTGTGGKGPSLAQPTLRHAPDDQRLIQVIRDGIPNSEMPDFWQFNDREVWQVAGYVRSLGRTAVVPLAGDPARGRALYESKGGCSTCHIIRGAGSSLGPELTEIGAQRNAEYLREAVVKPGASVPPKFLVVSVTTRDGTTVRGIRANEDTFTIQLRDAAGRFHSFRKSDLTQLKKEFHTSLMPSYDATLTPTELDDLVAYLAGLRGDS
jgi:cytochrome c oxidase cbb3-type subunit 3